MSKQSFVQVEIERIRSGVAERVSDPLVLEEPLQVFIQDQPVMVTLRTPGDEKALAVGLALTEGFINRPEDIVSIKTCDNDPPQEVYIELTQEQFQSVHHRIESGNALSRTSCSQCGKQLVEDIEVEVPRITKSGSIVPEILQQCSEKMEASQQLFKLTGATHAAALFDIKGDLIACCEDAGRHNALDKTIGKTVQAGRLADVFVGFITSRASFEMVQKAARAGVAVLGAYSGTTDLSVHAAERWNLTLAAFVRPGRCNIYSCPERIMVKRKSEKEILK